MNLNIMAKTYNLIVSEEDFEQIMIALEKRYLRYNDGYDDEDVYKYNTEIDKVIRNLINQTKGDEK